MSDPKARNTATKEEPVSKEKKVDMKRLLNVGKEVELSFGKFTVKELDVFSLISIASEGLETLLSLSSGGSELEMIQNIAKDENFKQKVAKILALFCGSDDYEPFAKIGLRDFTRVVLAIKEVVDIEEIKESFFALGLQKYLNLTPTSTETPGTQKETTTV